MPLIPQQHVLVQHVGITGFEPAVGKLKAQMDAMPQVRIVSLVADTSHLIAVVEEV